MLGARQIAHQLAGHILLYCLKVFRKATLCIWQAGALVRKLAGPFLYLLLNENCDAAQVFLVLVALVSVPIMLLPKPLILQKRFKARAAQLEEYGRVSPHDEDEESGVLRMAAPAHEHEEEFDFGEVMVHQVRGVPCTPVPTSCLAPTDKPYDLSFFIRIWHIRCEGALSSQSILQFASHLLEEKVLPSRLPACYLTFGKHSNCLLV